jgi:hypothetical protein
MALRVFPGPLYAKNVYREQSCCLVQNLGYTLPMDSWRLHQHHTLLLVLLRVTVRYFSIPFHRSDSFLITPFKSYSIARLSGTPSCYAVFPWRKRHNRLHIGDSRALHYFNMTPVSARPSAVHHQRYSEMSCPDDIISPCVFVKLSLWHNRIK